MSRQGRNFSAKFKSDLVIEPYRKVNFTMEDINTDFKMIVDRGISKSVRVEEKISYTF